MSYASKKAVRARSKTMMGSALYGPWKAPFHYNEEGCIIFDAGGHRVLDLRGWGYLTGQGCGALKLDQDTACAVQDRVGKRVVELLNKDFAHEQTLAAIDAPEFGREPMSGTLTFPEGVSVTFDSTPQEKVAEIVKALRHPQRNNETVRTPAGG